MNYSDDLLKMLSNQALRPQESMLEVANKGQKLYIGIPKESVFQENRVALVPNAVKVLVSVGHEVVVETGAGKRSNFVDKDYSEAGAKIARSFVGPEKYCIIWASTSAAFPPPLPEDASFLRLCSIVWRAIWPP